MDLSGIIFVGLALAWAGFLIPKALKHHDDVARTRSIDRFSSATRVLARREPVSKRDARLVVTGARPPAEPSPSPATSKATTSKVTTSKPAAAVARAQAQARRKAARVAARRRRRVLAFLLLCAAGTAVTASLQYLPWWSVAVPVSLTVLWLVLCRTQVRGESLREFEASVGASAAAEPLTSLPHRTVESADPADVEDTVGIPVPLLDAVVVPTEDGGTLWDPLPMTLPTYVGKPQAKRTVRTIDLGEPGTWTSGRTAEDAALVAQAEADRAASQDESGGTEQQRAVGS